jgi:hypothetical protein
MKRKIKLTLEQVETILNYKANTINEAVDNQNDVISFKVSGKSLFINFTLKPVDGDMLVKTYTKYFRKNTKKVNSYFMTAPVTGFDPFFSGNALPNIIKFLTERGYNIPSIDKLKIEAENEVRLDFATPEEKTQANEKYEDLIVKILSNLNDSKMQELISKISDFRVMADIVDNAFGHKFSGKNALRALAVKPDATFLATRSQWSKYNRKVNLNATKVLLWIKTGGGSYDQEKAEKELGISKSDAYKSTQMKHKFDLTASSSDSGGFIQKIYYDISDTTLEPGSDPNDLPSSDKIINEPGLIDNLKGVLNQMAIDMKGINLSPEERANLGAKDTSNKNVMVFSRVLNSMRMDETLKNITDNLIQLEPADDMSVYKVLKAYFMNVAFARASDDRELKSNIGTAGILAMDEIAPTALAILLKSNENILKLEKSDIIEVFGEMMKLQRGVIMSKNVIDDTNMTNEAENLIESGIKTPEDLIKLFGYSLSDLEDGNNDEDSINETEIEEKNKEIKESFFEVYNKLNNKNLLY